MESTRVLATGTSNNIPARARRAFTLIEMLIVVAIIGIISLVVYTSQTSFNKAVIVTDTAYTIALSLREAQTFGLSSVKFTDSSGNVTTKAGYGLHFVPGSPQTTSYIVFGDETAPGTNPGTSQTTNSTTGWCPVGVANTPEAKPGNCLYDVGETLRTYLLNGGFVISDICGTYTDINNNSTKYCTSQGSSVLSGIDIVFLRPNPETVITGYTGSTYTPLSCAVIHVKSPEGSEKCVVVSTLGEVSVPNSCPPVSQQSCP